MSASANVSGYAAPRRCTTSICSSVASTASLPGSDAGTWTDQNCAPTFPARSRGMSVCSGFSSLFYRAGARYMTLTHSDNNDWADSATDATPPA